MNAGRAALDDTAIFQIIKANDLLERQRVAALAATERNQPVEDAGYRRPGARVSRPC
jgi:hypothetical protein